MPLAISLPPGASVHSGALRWDILHRAPYSLWTFLSRHKYVVVLHIILAKLPLYGNASPPSPLHILAMACICCLAGLPQTHQLWRAATWTLIYQCPHGSRLITLIVPLFPTSTCMTCLCDCCAHVLLRQGVRITFAGGMAGRDLVQLVHCAPGKKLAPVGALNPNGGYVVTWEGAEGCGLPSSCPALPPLAKPTAAQMAWQAKEIGALIHFNVRPAPQRPTYQCVPATSG